MFLDTIRQLVRNENWPKANLHVTKENKRFKKNLTVYIYLDMWNIATSVFWELKNAFEQGYLTK